MGDEKLRIWTDKTDYVVAYSAEAARTTVIHCGGLMEEDIGKPSDWHAIPDDEPFPWQEEEGAAKIRIPAHEAVRRLTADMTSGGGCKIGGCRCQASYYFASTEW